MARTAEAFADFFDKTEGCFSDGLGVAGLRGERCHQLAEQLTAMPFPDWEPTVPKSPQRFDRVVLAAEDKKVLRGVDDPVYRASVIVGKLIARVPNNDIVRDDDIEARRPRACKVEDTAVA